MTRYDVVVLGGGIIGAAIAEELARSDKRVCLIERGTIGCEASKAAAGILSAQMDLEHPDAFFELCQASRTLYPSWVAHLERRAHRSVDYHVDGILYLALTDTGVRQMEARQHWQTRRGFRVERWSPQEVARREPNATEKIRAGFFFPTEAQLDNVKLMDALSVACRRAGVTVWERTQVRRVLTHRGAIVGVETSRQTCRAPIVVNCLGSWAPLVSRSSGLGMRSRTPLVVPARGQMLAFAAPTRLFHHVVMSEAAYGVQRRDGRLIVGSTVEFVGFEKRLTGDGMRAILSGFHRMVREKVLDRCAFQDAWVGLRPCSRDRLPILGETSVKGLYVAIGHFRHGILLAPVTAKLIAELILRGHSSFDLSPFSLSRFSK